LAHVQMNIICSRASPAKKETKSQDSTTSGLGTTEAQWADGCRPIGARKRRPYAKLDNPQSLNLYSYVFNNPISHLDDDGHEVITVQLRAYIPQASVGPYRGDNRGPTASQTVNSRTAITLTIETDPSISANPRLYNSGGIAGTTHNDVTGNSATQTVGLPTAQVSRDANGNVVINIQQDAKNPLTPAAVTPGIQSNVTVGVPVNGSSVTTSGTVSGSPAFELNVQTPGNSTTNIHLQGAPTNLIAFGAGLTQTNQLPTTTTPLAPNSQRSPQGHSRSRRLDGIIAFPAEVDQLISASCCFKIANR
jgi:hypothetical protein